MPIQLQNEIRKVYNGREYVIRPAGDQVEMDGIRYGTVTAVVRAIMGADWTPRVVARTFLGLPEYDGPRRTRTRRIEYTDGTVDEVVETKVGGKCQREGCYEPADCKHGFCSQHCTRGHSQRSYGDRRYPRNDRPHASVEVEVDYPDSRAFARGVGLDNGHRDGSLGTYGVEHKLLAESGKIADLAAELVEHLWKRRARVTGRCGLHVHLDARKMTAERKRALLDWAQRTQDVWFILMPPSRRQNNYVARLNAHNRNSHTTWMHETTYPTIEVRIHGGTLNPFKMRGWLTALVYMQTKTLDAEYAFPDTGDAEQDFWTFFNDCPTEGLQYLRDRKASNGQLRDHAYASLED